ncbi:CPBP family intramembrane glutamic endopeptidase [Streptomyces sp. NBC_01012]|uniref:CPBP family intramembrane glutamic endopeptidase n=1 Tax=Streptomyces sp. NBC_01012 TaxID=2903717 RepID=UPI003863C2FB|nr:CPBP family intramembrane metalloprotease [Streptomyces sp. NBC_01012]
MSRTSLPGTQRLKGLFSQTPIPGTPTSLVPARRVLPPGVRLALMAVLFLLVIALASGVRSIAGHQPVLAVLAGAVVAVGGLAAYAAAVRALEQRAVSELDLARAVPELRTGGLVGVGLFTATLTLIAVFGTYAPESGGSIGGMLAVLGMMAGVAVTEEVLFRGVVFRLVEELTGTRFALALSAVLFGALHLVNEGATVWGALAIGIEGGLLTAAAYAATRSLWMPIGIHWGWNFISGGVFGATVSGDDTTPVGLVRGVFSGPSAITGGGFGPEAGIFSVLVCSVATFLFLRTARRRGRLYGRGHFRAARVAGTESTTS